jgi:hypothetical protein
MLLESMRGDSNHVGIACPEYGIPYLPKYSPVLGARLPFVTPRPTGTVESVVFPLETLMLFKRRCLAEIGAFAEMSIYQDGTNCGGNSSGITIGSNGEPLCIGGTGSCTPTFSGQSAEMTLLDVALTLDEITVLTNGRPQPIVRGGSSLVAYWPLWGVYSPGPDDLYNARVTGATLANHLCGQGIGGF